MTWFKVDDGFYSSKKVMSIPRTQRLAAVGLWTMAGNWSGRELSDGHVPAYVLRELGATASLTQALVKARLWLDRGSGDIEFHDWARYQPTRAEIEANREKERIRKAEQRMSRRDTPGTTNGTPGGSGAESHGVSGYPDPTRPDPTKEEAKASSSGKKSETRLPADWAPTASHFERATEAGIDIAKQVQAFKLHAETHDRHAANWNAAFTSWLIKAKPTTGNINPRDEWKYR